MSFCPECNNVFDIFDGPSTVTTSDESEITASSEPEKVNKNTRNNKQDGGGLSPDNFVDKVLSNENIRGEDITGIDMKDLTNSKKYKNLQATEKEKVVNIYRDLSPPGRHGQESSAHAGTAVYICINCGFSRPITEGALIFSKFLKADYISREVYENPENAYSSIKLRTREYTCRNKDCESHQNPYKREAVIYREGYSFNTRYMCVACKTTWRVG